MSKKHHDSEPPTFHLGPKTPFRYVDLNFSEKERATLSKTDMSSLLVTQHYENYGDPEILEEEVARFVGSLGNDNSAASPIIASLVVRITGKILRITGQESAWVTIRAFKPTTAFSSPRWHADGHYYPPTGEQHKVAITLKGAQTVFYPTSQEQRLALEPFKYDSQAISAQLDTSKIVTPRHGQGVIFVVGGAYAPIHSEPDIDSDRLFMSIVPGSKTQIRTLYEETPERKITTTLQKNGFYTYFLGPKLGPYKSSPYENTEVIAFRLLPNKPSQLKAICQTTTQAHKGLTHKVVASRRSQVQLIFPEGAVITVHDLSPIIYESNKRGQIHNESDLHVILHQYLSTHKYFLPDAAAGGGQPDAAAGGGQPDAAAGGGQPDAAAGGGQPDAAAGGQPVEVSMGKNTTGLFRPTTNPRFSNLKTAFFPDEMLAKNPLAQRLGARKTFVNFSLKATGHEKECLKKLRIPTPSHYENYGDLSILRNELTDFIASLAEENALVSRTLANLIFRVIERVILYLGCETAWITVRAFPPVDTFSEPRWHADRYDYPPSSTGEQYKAAVTLKGPGTLFYNSSLEERLALERFKSDKRLLDAGMDQSKLVTAKPGSGTIFSIGQPFSPIHSEPHTNRERLFLAVVPGSTLQIEKLRSKTPEYKIMQALCSNGFYCYFLGPRLKQDFIASPYEETELLVFDKNACQPLSQQPSDISPVVKQIGSAIDAEVVPCEPSIIKLQFKQGGFILMRDISSFFKQNSINMASTTAVQLALQKYTEEHGLIYNAITGRNTAGLFQPHSLPHTEVSAKARF